MRSRETEFQALMLAAQRGDQVSYHTLLSAILRSFIRKMGIGPNDVDDVTQNTLIAIHNSRHTYLPERLFMTWVFSICRRKIYDHFTLTTKVRKQEINDEEQLLRFLKEDSASEASSEDTYNRAIGMLNKLPKVQKEIVTALKVDGRHVRDLAQQHNMSESAVKTAAHRGYKKLKTMFAKIAQKGDLS